MPVCWRGSIRNTVRLAVRAELVEAHAPLDRLRVNALKRTALSLVMKTLKLGIAAYEDMRARTLSIAKGELKPKAGGRRFGLPRRRILPSCYRTAIVRYSA